MRERVDELERRARTFAIGVVRLTSDLGSHWHLREIARQLVRSACSVSANQRAMRRSRSLKEFAAKLQIVNEEIDESANWLEMLRELIEPTPPELARLVSESLELRAMYAKARTTTKAKLDADY
jgi:four helix bundle protein